MTGTPRDLATDVARDRASRGTRELIDDLLTSDHAYLRQSLPIIEALAARVAEVHGADDGDLVSLAVSVRRFADRVRWHLDRAERELFPALLNAADPDGARTALGVSDDEHRAIIAWVERMRALTHGFRPPEGACGSHRTLLAELSAIDRTLSAHVVAEAHLARRAEADAEAAAKPESIYPTAPSPDRFEVAAIEATVHAFYERVRADEVLGPIFEARIDDWPHHLERMVLFWGSVLRREPGFKPSRQGPPPVLHRRIEALDLVHYERWLSLWGETVAPRFAPDLAEYVYACACRIADVFSAGLRAPGAGIDEAPPRSRWYAGR